MSLLRSSFSRYRVLLDRNPLLTNVCTAVPLMIVGDCAAQSLEGGASLNYQRTVTMALYSGMVFTPLFFKLYNVADRVLKGSRLALAAQKSLFVIVFGAFPVNAAFLSLATFVEMNIFGMRPKGHSLSTSAVIKHKLENDFIPIVTGSLTFWTPINFCNFYFCPLKYRVLVSSVAAVFWNCYLSLMQHKYLKEKKRENV